MNRRDIARWIAQMVPVESLVPEDVKHWRPLVLDALGYVFAHLSQSRLEAKIQEQMLLPLDTPAEQRLLRLIARMPGIQKVGQVLARNRRISPALRGALSQLENGITETTVSETHAAIERALGERLKQYAVEIEPVILSEASVSAVMRFAWNNPGREREQGVFKVMKAHVPACFDEDMRLLQQLAEYLARKSRRYAFGIRHVTDTVEEVRLLLQHELDFERERSALGEAARMYRSSFGVRVPRVIPQLCGPGVTAMTAERGVKVTEAFRRFPLRRMRIAEQIIEAMVAVPYFSWEDTALFHADPHAGNLLYDEPNRELIVLDWALAERLDRESRRQLVLLVLAALLRNREGVFEAVMALSREDRQPNKAQLIREHTEHLFTPLQSDDSLGILEAMRLLEEIALAGVRFPAALFLFRKVLFTLEGVLHDVAGHDVAINQVILREFLGRMAASFGIFHAPLRWSDFATIQRDAVFYPWRRWMAG